MQTVPHLYVLPWHKPKAISGCMEEHVNLVHQTGKLHDMVVKYEAGTLPFTPNCPLELLKHQK